MPKQVKEARFVVLHGMTTTEFCMVCAFLYKNSFFRTPSLLCQADCSTKDFLLRDFPLYLRVLVRGKSPVVWTEAG